jgi:hypothetical protein
MTLQDLGSIGELVGGLAVVLSLAYVAYQVRQNSRQIEHNSRQLEASMYLASGESFVRFWSLMVQDEDVAGLWHRGVAGETLGAVEKVRFNGLVMILFNAFENNFHQEQIGAHHRGTLEISRSTLSRMLASPGVGAWWAREARRSLTPEFVRAVESLISIERPAESGENAA